MSAEARIKAKISADATEFDRTLTGVGQKVNKFTTGQLAQMGSMIGGAFAVGAIVEWGRTFTDWAGKVSDAAGILGVRTQAFASLNAVFEGQGLGVDELSKMMNKLEADIFAAANGSKALPEIYKELGYTIQDLVQMDPIERFKALSAAALETASPVGALADLYGQKLGPKARLALEEMVGGYDLIDAANAEMIDRLDQAGDKWAAHGSKFKTDFVLPVMVGIANLGDGLEALMTLFGKPVEGKGWLNFGAKWGKAVQNYNDEQYAGIDARNAADAASEQEQAELQRKLDAKRSADFDKNEKAFQKKRADYRAANAKLATGELDGEAQIRAKAAAEIAAIQNDIDNPDGDPRLKKDMRDRQALIRLNTAKEIADYRKKAEKEIADQQEKTGDISNKISKRYADAERDKADVIKAEKIAVQPVNSLASIGGFVGGKAGASMYAVSSAERQVKVAERIAEIEEKTRVDIGELATQLEKAVVKLDEISEKLGV